MMDITGNQLRDRKEGKKSHPYICSQADVNHYLNVFKIKPT